MNYSIEGKANISNFIQILKLFDMPKMMATEDGIYNLYKVIQFQDVQDQSEFNVVNASDRPSMLVELTNFFSYSQVKVRELHFKYSPNSNMNIELLKQTCSLNSALDRLVCYFPSCELYKVIQPLIGFAIKSIDMGFCHMPHLGNALTLNMSIQLESGLFFIEKRLIQAQSQWIVPEISEIVMTIDHERCRELKSELNKKPFQILFLQDEVILRPSMSNQISLLTNQQVYSNTQFLKEFRVQLEQVHSKTYLPILHYCSRLKLQMNIHLTEGDNAFNIDFVLKTPKVLIISRQKTGIIRQRDVLFFDDELAEDINSQHEIFSKQQEEVSETHPAWATPYASTAPDKKRQSNITNQSTFVPLKIENSISETIQSLIQRAKMNR